MNNSSRRRFLGAAGAGAAAVGVSAVAPGSAFAGETRRSANAAAESLVALVEDVDSGELTLLVGEREVVVHDRDLVNRLLNAAGKK